VVGHLALLEDAEGRDALRRAPVLLAQRNEIVALREDSRLEATYGVTSGPP